MFLLGLTGSIGMGKSTTAQMFVDLGCDLWDADAAVHRLYSPGGAAVEPVRKAFPTAIVDGAVSRTALKEIMASDPSTLQQLEKIVHPLVAQDRAYAISGSTAQIMVLDIPLIFETGAEGNFDAVACVLVDAATQADRVMARGTMTKAQFEAIRAKQLPAEDKAAKADYVIDTSTLDSARSAVQDIVRDIKKRLADA